MSSYYNQNNENDYTQGGAYAALIEWDGAKPPTRWYDRLHSLGYRVGQRSVETPLARRQGHNGLAFQEGALLCKEESEARTLCFLASELGARSALVIAYTAIDTSCLSEADVAALSRVQTVLGRRGRPPKATPHVSYCYDCGHTTATSGVAFRCDHCGGTDLRQREGEKRIVRLPLEFQGSLNGYWASRTLDGAPEEPDLRDWDEDQAELIDIAAGDTTHPQFQAILKTDAYRVAVDAFSQGRITWRELYRILDIILLVQAKDAKVRLEHRLDGITKFVRGGGDASNLVIAVRPNEVDLIDLFGAVRDNVIHRLLFAR